MPLSQLKQDAVHAIQDSYRLLQAEQNLSPTNDRVTHSLTNLVRTLSRCQAPELACFLLNTPELTVEREELPLLCGLAECEMEKFWARHLIDCEVCDLREFWYYPEYMSLCQAELDLFKSRRFSRISFLGAGALPLTAFMLAHHCPDTPVICVDFDREACDLAKQLSRKIGMEDQVQVTYMNALEYRPVPNELVICASLLQGRTEVYHNLQAYDCAMIVRDSEGPYRYLYRAAELPAPEIFSEIAKTSIDPKRINTSRYFVRTVATAEYAAAA